MNLVALPEQYAQILKRFAAKIPTLSAIRSGWVWELPRHIAWQRTRTQKYASSLPWRDGRVQQEKQDVTEFYQEDLVFFPLGCSFSFESALVVAGTGLRHVEEQRNVSCTIPTFH